MEGRCPSPSDENSRSADPLLNQEQREDDLDSVNHAGEEKSFIPGVSPRSRYNTLRAFFAIQAIFLVLYAGLTFFLLSRLSHPKSNASYLLPLPAREAVQWETRQFPTDIRSNPLAGEPRSELERAWHDLLNNDNVAVSLDDLKTLGQSSVRLATEESAVVSLGVFHALHCLKKVRHMTYKEHYHQNKDDKAMRRERLHADHCIEYIRESLMCHADLSFVTYRWINQTAQHPDDPSASFPTSFDSSQHECINWPALNDWATERRFDLFRTDLLHRPESTSK